MFVWMSPQQVNDFECGVETSNGIETERPCQNKTNGSVAVRAKANGDLKLSRSSASRARQSGARLDLVNYAALHAMQAAIFPYGCRDLNTGVAGKIATLSHHRWRQSAHRAAARARRRRRRQARQDAHARAFGLSMAHGEEGSVND